MGSPRGKILVLSNNKIYTYDFLTKDTTLYSPLGSKIFSFSISPLKQYLAYTNILKYCISYSDDDTDTISEPGYMPVCSINVIDLKTQRLIKEIPPPDTTSLYDISEWSDINELRYYDKGSIDLGKMFKYKVYGYVDTIPDDEIADQLFVRSKNFTSKFVVDDVHVLHKISLLTKRDVILAKIENIFLDAELSNNSKTTSWLERKDFSKLNPNSYIYKLFTISTDNFQKKEVYSCSDNEGESDKLLSFSPNDSIVSISLFSKIILVNLYTNSQCRVIGKNIHWLDSNRFIFIDSNNLNLYDLRLKRRELILKNVENAINL